MKREKGSEVGIGRWVLRKAMLGLSELLLRQVSRQSASHQKRMPSELIKRVPQEGVSGMGIGGGTGMCAGNGENSFDLNAKVNPIDESAATSTSIDE